MKTKLLLLTLAVIILFLQPTISLTRTVHAASETTNQSQTSIAILPAQTEKTTYGNYLKLSVSAENCTNIYGIQVDIKYDPAVLRAISVNPAKDTPFPLIAVNASNVYDENLNLTYNGRTYAQIYYVAAIPGEINGFTGEANLFTIVFKVISLGSSPIELVKYVGSGSPIGTYFMNPKLDEIIPTLYSSNYGETGPSPIDAPPDTIQQGQASSAFFLPSLFLPLAALLLFVVKRNISRRRSIQ
jgi:hypothetical protein